MNSQWSREVVPFKSCSTLTIRPRLLRTSSFARQQNEFAASSIWLSRKGREIRERRIICYRAATTTKILITVGDGTKQNVAFESTRR